MDGAAAFAAIYATLAELSGVGIDRVGVISARRGSTVALGDPMPWPHTGSVALHSVIASVAMVAALLITVVTAAFHHSVQDLAVLAVPLVLGFVVLSRTVRRLTTAQDEPSRSVSVCTNSVLFGREHA